MDYVSEFTAAMARAGLEITVPVVADGQMHRFMVADDKGDKKNGWYRLILDGGAAFGVFGCWKRGISEKWHSKERREYSPADRERLKERRALALRGEEELQAKAARKAQALWKRAKEIDDSHPYLERKRITGRKMRRMGDTLYVPSYVDGKLVSLQFIGADGQKRFLTGGRRAGAYMSIAEKDDSREIIYICEGYATGASIYEAVKMPVVVAFNAGNLKPVAEAIRAKYPAAKIIIAADNDQWTLREPREVELRGVDVSEIIAEDARWREWDEKGWTRNPGLEYARAAAAAVDAEVVFPAFDRGATGKPTDFNDLELLAGAQAVRDALQGVEVVPPEPEAREVGKSPMERESDGREVVAADEDWKNDWRLRLRPGKVVVAGYPHPYDSKSHMNAVLFLQHSEKFAGIFVYNAFSDEIMVVRCPPWEDDGRFRPRRLEDTDAFMLACHLEYIDIKIGKQAAMDAAIEVAKASAINPPREYFERLVWDGTPRLNKWLSYYLGADQQPEEYLALVGSKWMIGAVSRVYQPGAKFDCVLVLEGEQGIGKSTALRVLATFGGQEFFSDSVGELSSKDTIIGLQGKLIVEVGELASFKRAENREIKAFISRQVDEYRPPYGRTVVSRPRYFVLASTTNEIDEGILTDDTGNRRYWPVRSKKIDIAALTADREQLWAEAVYRYKAGERTWLVDEEVRFATHEQQKRFMEDAWQEQIEKIVRANWETSTAEICKALELKPKDINNVTRSRIKNSLKSLGWYETKREGQGRIWKKRDETGKNYELVLDTVL